MQTGFFEKQIVLTPDLCGSAAALSPLAAFTIFQGVASEHAEKIGVGGAAMAKRGEFWLTVHSRVDFYEPAYLMDELTARTWPEQCEGRDIRCFRSYRLTRGEQTVALGRTQWAILGPEQKILRFEQSGFPADFPFPDAAAIAEPPVRFHDELTQDELIYTHLVRATDIDMGRHMNNVVYIRLLLDCLPAKELASGRIKSIEAHYASPCLEGETLGVFCRRKERLCRMAVRPGTVRSEPVRRRRTHRGSRCRIHSGGGDARRSPFFHRAPLRGCPPTARTDMRRGASCRPSG